MHNEQLTDKVRELEERMTMMCKEHARVTEEIAEGEHGMSGGIKLNTITMVSKKATNEKDGKNSESTLQNIKKTVAEVMEGKPRGERLKNGRHKVP